MAIALCRFCNKEFTPSRGSKGIFCSSKCYWKYMKGKPSGCKPMLGKIAWNKSKKFPDKSGSNSAVWRGGNSRYYKER